MKVLILHNRYRQPGGEEAVVRDEAAMLERYRHDVHVKEFDNGGSAAQLLLASAWRGSSYDQVLDLCRRLSPDVVHIHNFWMKLTPSAHAACREAGVPTVQTLHNFRLLCTNALLMRQNRVCEDCLGKSVWRGVARRCYHSSFPASAAVGVMITINRLRGTWHRDVQAFVAPSEHSARTFAAGGFEESKLFVKPHFVADPGPSPQPPSQSNAILYVGRLSTEKGPNILLKAWAHAELSRHGRLLIAGDGPERAALEEQSRQHGLPPGAVSFLGRKTPEEVRALIGEVRAVVAPSICYETFGRAVAEGFAGGRPVIASDIGAVGEAVDHQVTGLKVAPLDFEALGSALRDIMLDGRLADTFGAAARQAYLDRYTMEHNHETLMRIYSFAMQGAHS